MSEAEHHPHHQRPRTRHRGRAAAHAGRRHPRGLRADRHPSRLRARHLRCLHRHRRRRAGALVPDVRRAGRRQENSHRRRLGERRQIASDAAGLHGSPRPAMRILHAGFSDAGGRRARARAGYQRRRSARRARRPTCAAAPVTRTSSRPCAPRRKKCAANDRPAEIRRPLRPAAGGPPAPHRPGPLRRRHFVSRPMAMRVVRSPVAHGKIKSIDAAAPRWRCPACTRCGRMTTSRTSRRSDSA